MNSVLVHVWSVGHSNHDFAAFLALPAAHRIEAVADIRRFPVSRRHPQFLSDALAAALAEHRLLYRHLPQLGGRRTPRKDSPNDGWNHRSFRGYADHALTEEFAAGLAALRDMAGSARTAMMCSESLWWRCHRRLVADRLVAGGHVVLHVFPDASSSPHELTPFARLDADGTTSTPPTRSRPGRAPGEPLLTSRPALEPLPAAPVGSATQPRRARAVAGNGGG